MDVLSKAAERLTELSGDVIVPLEEDISKGAQKLLPELQSRYASLSEKLTTLDLPGPDKMESLNRQIADLLLTDCSDAPSVFGAENSPLFDQLQWAQKVKVAFDQRLDSTIHHLRDLQREFTSLPKTGAPGDLLKTAEDDMESIKDLLSQQNFFDHTADISTKRTNIESRVAETVQMMARAQTDHITEAAADLARIPEWGEFTAEEQQTVLAELQELAINVSKNIAGLKTLNSSRIEIFDTIQQLKNHIITEGKQRHQTPPKSTGSKPEARERRPLMIPEKITNIQKHAPPWPCLVTTSNQLQTFTTLSIFTNMQV